MNDFFENKEEQKTNEEVIEKIKVGEKEYTQDELSELVGMGEKTREIESTLNTKIDRVYPEFTKSSQRNKELEAKIKEMEEAKNAPQDLNEDSIKQAREAAKKIGIVTKDDFATFMQEHFRNAYQQERQAERLLDDCKSLEKEFDGTNGQPKFKTQDVLQWMADNGGKSPKQAYKMMYEKEIDTYKQTVLAKAKPAGMMTEDGGNAGGKEPSKVPVTRDNIDQLMREALGQGE
jgi:hypothetical protein